MPIPIIVIIFILYYVQTMTLILVHDLGSELTNPFTNYIMTVVVVIINNNINDVYFGEHFILSDRIILSR